MEGFKILFRKFALPRTQLSQMAIRAFLLSTLSLSTNIFAGYFEISGNGSYYLYNNGKTLGEQNTTSVQRLGLGLGYNFTSNTSIEFKYTNSKKHRAIYSRIPR